MTDLPEAAQLILETFDDGDVQAARDMMLEAAQGDANRLGDLAVLLGRLTKGRIPPRSMWCGPTAVVMGNPLRNGYAWRCAFCRTVGVNYLTAETARTEAGIHASNHGRNIPIVEAVLPGRGGRRIRRPGPTMMPPTAVWVGAGSVFDNPFTVADVRGSNPAVGEDAARLVTVQAFYDWLHTGVQHWPISGGDAQRDALLEALPGLVGKDVACGCEPGQECHGDVLAEGLEELLEQLGWEGPDDVLPEGFDLLMEQLGRARKNDRG